MTTILKYLDLKRILILKWTTPERNNRNPYNRTLNKLDVHVYLSQPPLPHSTVSASPAAGQLSAPRSRAHARPKSPLSVTVAIASHDPW